MNKLENKNRQNRVPLSPLKSGLQVSVGHFFYLVSPKISHFLNSGRKQTWGQGEKRICPSLGQNRA